MLWLCASAHTHGIARIQWIEWAESFNFPATSCCGASASFYPCGEIEKGKIVAGAVYGLECRAIDGDGATVVIFD